MSESPSKGRIQRKEKPPRYYATHKTYRPYLFKDFEGRCAYSMQHYTNAGGESAMDIDHFNPKLPNHTRNKYENLFLASRHCNGHKLQFWPTPQMMDAGIRFLNPCLEQDYGEHLFEDPVTFEIWSETPAGKFHIRILKLNAEHLVRERKMRHEYRKIMDAGGYFQYQGQGEGELSNAMRGWSFAKEYLQKTIPPISQRPKPTSESK